MVRGLLELAAKGVRVTGRLAGAFLQEQLETLFYDDRYGWTWRPNSIRRVLNRIEQRGWLVRQVLDEEFGPTYELQLTPTGRIRLDQLWIGDLTLSGPPAVWDGLWRMVLFDVPEERKALRGIFRRKVQQFGFQYLQKSVWIYPYPCETELTELAERLELKEHIHVAVVQSLSSDARVRQQFALTVSNRSVSMSLPPEELTEITTGDRIIASDSSQPAAFVGDLELVPLEELD